MRPIPLLFICFLGFVSLVAANFDVPSSVPLLVWSRQNYFGGNQQHLNTISNLDVEKLLQTSVGVDSSIRSSVDSLLHTLKTQHPEVVVLFIESNFGTEQLSQLSSAYFRDTTNGVFTNLKGSLGSASSSIIFPYTLSGNSFSLSDTILEVASQLRSQQPAASISLVRPEGSQTFNNLASSSAFTTKTPQQFLAYLENAPIHQNGVTDLIVVSFNQNFAQDDAFLGNVERIVSQKTEGKYLSMFSGLHPSRSRVVRSVMAASDYSGGLDCGSHDPHDLHNCSSYTSYFPIAVFQIILIVVILLVIVCFGIICACSVQTPARFEVPKQKRAENPM